MTASTGGISPAAAAICVDCLKDLGSGGGAATGATSFDAKRWVSRTLSLVAAAAASQPPGDSATSAGRAAGLAAAGSSHGVDEATVAAVATSLQLHLQELSAAADDVVHQAMVRLPRALVEVDRLAADRASLSEQLEKAMTKATPNADTKHPIAALRQDASSHADVAAQLERLHSSRVKLVRCRRVLDEAQSLSSSADSVERRLQQLIATAGQSAAATPGGTATGGGGAGTQQAAMDALASDISKMQRSVVSIQAIDAAYAAGLQARVQGVEQRLQQCVERECLDAVRRQDLSKAPRMLATLRRIGREGGVLDNYVSHVVASRRDKVTDITTAPSGQVAGTLARFYASVVKTAKKEAEFLSTLLARVHQYATPSSATGMPSAPDPTTPSSPEPLIGATAVSAASVAAGTAAALGMVQRVLIGILDQASPVMTTKFEGLSAPELVACYQHLRSELEAPCRSLLLFTGGGQPQHDQHAATSQIADGSGHVAAVTAAARRPFVGAVRRFASQESQWLRQVAATVTTADDFFRLTDAVCESARRCSEFDPESTVSDCVTAWQDVVGSTTRRVVERAVADATRQPALPSGTFPRSTIKSLLEAQLKAQLIADTVAQCDATVTNALASSLPPHAVSAMASVPSSDGVAANSSSGAAASTLLSAAVAAAVAMAVDVRGSIVATATHPLTARLQPLTEHHRGIIKEQQQSAAARDATSVPGSGNARTSSISSGAQSIGMVAAPSEEARRVGEWLMELPVELDAVCADEAAQRLLSRIVTEAVAQVVVSLQQLVTESKGVRPSAALPQRPPSVAPPIASRLVVAGGGDDDAAATEAQSSPLLDADLDYLVNVVTAIDGDASHIVSLRTTTSSSH